MKHPLFILFLALPTVTHSSDDAPRSSSALAFGGLLGLGVYGFYKQHWETSDVALVISSMILLFAIDRHNDQQALQHEQLSRRIDQNSIDITTLHEMIQNRTTNQNRIYEPIIDEERAYQNTGQSRDLANNYYAQPAPAFPSVYEVVHIHPPGPTTVVPRIKKRGLWHGVRQWSPFHQQSRIPKHIPYALTNGKV